MTDRLMEEYGVPTHPRAAEFTCPKWAEPGRCICGQPIPPMAEWTDAGRDWASFECPACGRGYVDEEEFIAIYDDGLSPAGGDPVKEENDG